MYSDIADPCVYYWPVSGMHVVARVLDVDSEQATRMRQALFRDGASWVTLVSGRQPPYRYLNFQGKESWS